MAVHSSAVIDTQVIADGDGIVVGEGEVEAVPGADAAKVKEGGPLTLPLSPDASEGTNAGEVNGVAADGEFYVKGAVVGSGVEDLDEADVDARVWEDFHGVDFRAGFVLEVGGKDSRRGVGLLVIPMEKIG